MTAQLPPPSLPLPSPQRRRTQSERFDALPRPLKLALVGAGVIAALTFAIRVAPSSDEGAPTRADAAERVTARVDKCHYDSDGWLDAGGMLTNHGDEATSVKVNLLVSGKYVDFTYIPSIGPGETVSWNASEPMGLARGNCTAELDDLGR